MKNNDKLNIINNILPIKDVIHTIEDCPYRQSLIFDVLSRAGLLETSHTQQALSEHSEEV